MPFDSLPITSPVIEALREGRARIERGWCQKSLRTEDGAAFCALGALCDPDTDSEIMEYPNWSALDLLKDALRSGDVTRWNDAPERTQADVVALYDRAIELAIAEALDADLS